MGDDCALRRVDARKLPRAAVTSCDLSKQADLADATTQDNRTGGGAWTQIARVAAQPQSAHAHKATKSFPPPRQQNNGCFYRGSLATGAKFTISSSTAGDEGGSARDNERWRPHSLDVTCCRVLRYGLLRHESTGRTPLLAIFRSFRDFGGVLSRLNGNTHLLEFSVLYR